MQLLGKVFELSIRLDELLIYFFVRMNCILTIIETESDDSFLVLLHRSGQAATFEEASLRYGVPFVRKTGNVFSASTAQLLQSST